jgi:dTDP-4-amino-4,6-dideoxygalactose transaminase
VSAAESHVPFVDLGPLHAELRPQIDAAIAAVIDAGSFILGPDVAAFEREWAEYCEAGHAVGVGSGTAALEVTMRALGIGPGDEVIAPANTFIATVLPVLAVGAEPILVDCDEQTANIDVDAVRAAVSPRTRAIVPVHLYGQPADMEPLAEIAAEAGAYLVEDACQAHGARYRGRRVGALGTAGCFSFYPGKNLGALGDAGAVVTDDAELAERVRLIRDLGQERKYVHVTHGHNERLDTVQAAVLRVKLPHLDRWNEARRAAAAVYEQALGGTGLALPWTAPERDHVYHLYVVRSERRDALRDELARRGVGTGLHYPTPVHLQPALAHLGHEPGSFPVAERWARELVSLPMFAHLAPEEARDAAERVADAVGALRATARPAA